MPMCFVKMCAEKAVVVGVNGIACRCVPSHRTACYGTICSKVCGRNMFFATFKKKNGDFLGIECRFLSPTPFPAF
jgi:hypothetical protein